MSEENIKENSTENITQLNEYFKHIDELLKVKWGANLYVFLAGEPLRNLRQYDWLQSGFLYPSCPPPHFLHYFTENAANVQELALSAGGETTKTEAESESVAAEAIFGSFVAEIGNVRSRMLQMQEDIDKDKEQTRAVIAKLQA